MADNPFSVQVVNPLQALLIGQKAYTSGIENNKKQAMEAARQEAGQLYAAGDTKGALARLLTGGDLQGAGTYSGLDQNAWQRQHTTNRDAVSDQRWSASHELARRASERADEVKPVFKEITDPNTGATSIIAIDPRTLKPTPIDTGVAPSAPNNPFSAGGKFNEGQGKAAGFADRMLQSEGILSGVAVPEGYQGPTTPGVQDQGRSVTQSGLSKIPGVGNYLVSNERQKFEQAKRDFINAQLRRESGAAISPTEFESADKQYFPVPGDKPDVIRQKEANRRAAIEALGREGGPSYRPKLNFAPDGGVRPVASGRPISKAQYDALPSGTPFTAPDGSRRVKP